jgi:hypothetical protein
MDAGSVMRYVGFAAVVAVAGVSHAQLVSGVSVQPAQVTAGGSVKATVNFDVMSGTNCGLRVQWGDGTTGDFKINQAKDVPLVASHTYANPGSYRVVAEPKTQGMTVPRCGGRNQETTVTVVAAAPAVSAGPAAKTAAKAPAKTAVNPCPAGWKLAQAGVNKKTSAFACSAPSNTRLPEAKVSCPGDLTYFENVKKGQLGCRA